MDKALEAAYTKLKSIRTRTDLSLAPLKHLKKTFTHLNKEQELKIRYYQVQGILHMIVMSRFVLGDDTGIGKTIQAIATLCFLWERKPNLKVIVVTDKSAVLQWAAEFEKFTTGVNVIPYLGDPLNPLKNAQNNLPDVEWQLENWEDLEFDEDESEEMKLVRLAKHEKLRTRLTKRAAKFRKLLNPDPKRKRKRKAYAKDREDLRKDFEKSTGPTVLVTNYDKVRIDISHIQGWSDYILIFDECQAFKNPSAQIHQVAAYLSSKAQRTWGLTATLIQNRLMEGFGIYKVVLPGLFGSKTDFMYDYSIVEMTYVSQDKKVPRIVGHSPEHIEKFKEMIDPYYLGRAKKDVAKELPTLTIKTMEVPMSSWQERKYEEALEGFLELGDGELKETTKLTQITYCQQIVNHPGVLGFTGESPKLDLLIDLLTTGEYYREKAIVFSRSKKMIHIIMAALKAKKIEAVTVTGDDKDKAREKHKNLFQDMESGVNVICCTDAAKQAINLQAAKVIIFFDTDFSGGVYLQKLGRMIRIGSKHSRVYALHLQATKGRGKKTIDHRCMDILSKKMDLINAVLGERVKGYSTDAPTDTPQKERGIRLDEDSELSLLFSALREDAIEAKGPK